MLLPTSDNARFMRPLIENTVDSPPLV